MYELKYRQKAIKALSKINEPHYTAIIAAIDKLVENPRPHGYKKLTGRNGYRLRAGTYRIIYDIFDKELVIEIVNIGVRGKIYEH